jgi:formylglycine-generating enzyme required for sulfatase activity
MIGNCWEMTSSLLRDFPYDVKDGRENPFVNENRVIKGGSYSSKLVNLRCDARDYRGI